MAASKFQKKVKKTFGEDVLRATIDAKGGVERETSYGVMVVSPLA